MVVQNFYPRPPRGGRHFITFCRRKIDRFLSTPSARRATCSANAEHKPNEFLSTPSARRATIVTVSAFFNGEDFYPRPPRGGRQYFIAGEYGDRTFLSTPSARRATQEDSLHVADKLFLSTPSARRATKIRRCSMDILLISIHALREEGDALSTSM